MKHILFAVAALIVAALIHPTVGMATMIVGCSVLSWLEEKS